MEKEDDVKGSVEVRAPGNVEERVGGVLDRGMRGVREGQAMIAGRARDGATRHHGLGRRRRGSRGLRWRKGRRRDRTSGVRLGLALTGADEQEHEGGGATRAEVHPEPSFIPRRPSGQAEITRSMPSMR